MTLDIYLNGDNEQQTVCPKCGARTAALDIQPDHTHEQCQRCGYEFILEFDDESI